MSEKFNNCLKLYNKIREYLILFIIIITGLIITLIIYCAIIIISSPLTSIANTVLIRKTKIKSFKFIVPAYIADKVVDTFNNIVRVDTQRDAFINIPIPAAYVPLIVPFKYYDNILIEIIKYIEVLQGNKITQSSSKSYFRFIVVHGLGLDVLFNTLIMYRDSNRK
jgi:hypothetical protein